MPKTMQPIINRISREQAFMLTAQVWAQRSTCMRRAVGAVVVINNRIVSHGYNGAPPGDPHCDGVTCVPEGQIGCARSVHAEANAVNYVPDALIGDNKTMFTTESPCIACAALMMHTKFTALYYLNEYRVVTGVKHMIGQGIPVYRMTPAGMIVKKTVVGGELHETLC